MKLVKKVLEKIRERALSIITLILLGAYLFISYRTYIIQQYQLDIVRTTYQLTLHLEELERQNDCMSKILEILELLESQ